MSKLHSNAKAHSLAKTKRIVRAAFGDREWDEIFEEFEEHPLGVGAMGQVYKAKLRQDLKASDSDRGTEDLMRHSQSLMDRFEQLQAKDVNPPADWVVVKVLHPGVRSLVRRDLKIMRFFAQIINAIPTMEWLSLPDEVAMFAKMMRLQLDLRIEAENLVVFRNNFKDSNDITFPKPYTSFTTRDVLVEEYIRGIPMGLLLQFTNNSRLDKEVAERGLDSFLKMLLLDNFIHSDLHPGNIVVRLYKKGELGMLGKGSGVTSEHVEQVTNRILDLERSADVWNRELDALYEQGYRPQVCYIDTGLVTELDDMNRRNFIDLFKAISKFDGYRVGELMVERSRTPETAIDPDVFALKVQRLVQHIKSRTFALGSVKLGDLLGRMLSMVRDHHVRMEGDFVTVVLSILLLEGIGRRLEPDIDLFKSSIPILRQLGPTQNEIIDEDALSMLKVWLVIEVRQFINASIQDVHEVVKYDRLSPNE